MPHSTRKSTNAAKQKLARQGLNLDNIIFTKRNTRVPNRIDNAPSLYRDRFGNRHFNPGNTEITRRVIKFSGDSRKDIRALVKSTGLGGRGSGQVWHHMSDVNSDTGKGTVILMPSRIHFAMKHVGGSALRRTVVFDDPEKRAKYGVVMPRKK